MVNLRYHIVSIVAVFMALGIGVVMGSTVIDRGIVDVLNRRVDTVERSLRGLNENNRRQGEQLGQWSRFAEQGRDQLLAARLRDVPVVILAVAGIDRRPVDELIHQLGIAQARVQGTVWLTRKLRLDNDGDVKALAATLGGAVERPDDVRRTLITRLAGALATPSAPPSAQPSSPPNASQSQSSPQPGGPPGGQQGGQQGAQPGSQPGGQQGGQQGGQANAASLLPALRDGAFVDFEPSEGPSGVGDIAALAQPGTRIVIVSGAGAQVADDALAVPLTESLAVGGARVLAAESGRDTPGGRSVFVGALRDRSDVAGRVATLDNLESFMGQTAAVLAIEDLAVPRVGHFGVGPGAQRLLPAAPPS